MDTARVCLRCTDCLDVAFCDAPLITSPGGARAVSTAWARSLSGCPNNCGGRVELLGRVIAQHVYREHEATACDERCTAAPGRKCACSCKGENHGTGRTITVLDGGQVMPREQPLATAIARAAAWRAACAAFRQAFDARYGRVLADKAAGRWLPSFDEYLTATRLQQAMNRARALRSHAGRMAAVARLAEQVFGSAGSPPCR